MRVLYLVLLILVITTVVIGAQQQNGRNKNRNGSVAQSRQQQQQNQKQRQQNGNKNRNRKGNNKVRAEVPEKKVKKTLVNHIIPGLGAVRGRMLKSEWTGQNIVQFFDIPYAKSSSGAMRFKPSLPVAPWTGTLKAERPFGGCPALQDDSDYSALKSRNIEVEDCLRLTINTKSVRPVLTRLIMNILR